MTDQPPSSAMSSEPAPEQPPPPPEDTPAKGGRALKVIGPIAGIVVIAVAGFVIRNAFSGGDEVPEVGECLSNTLSFDDLDVVDCGAGDAALRVVGNAGTMTEQAFEETSLEEMCEGAQSGENALWLGEQTDDLSGDGEVVCLAPVDAADAESGEE